MTQFELSAHLGLFSPGGGGPRGAGAGHPPIWAGGGGRWGVGVEWLAHRWEADEFYLSSELVEQVPPVTLEFRMRQNEDAGGGAGIPDREGSGAISVEGQGYYSK